LGELHGENANLGFKNTSTWSTVGLESGKIGRTVDRMEFRGTEIFATFDHSGTITENFLKGVFSGLSLGRIGIEQMEKVGGEVTKENEKRREKKTLVEEKRE
jgi:hypothetical protein